MICLSTDSVPLWAVVIAPVGAVVAALGGVAYRYWRDEQHWRSENRLSAYLDFVEAARGVLFRGADIGGIVDSSDAAADLRSQKARMRDEMERLRQAATRVMMLGPVELSDIADDVLDYYAHELYAYFEAIGQPPSERPPVVVEASRLLVEFQRAAAERLSIFRQAR